MFHALLQFLIVAGSVAVLLTALAMLLTRLAALPQWLTNTLARAPALDAIVAAFTWIPWLCGWIRAGSTGVGGWVGLLGAIAGQVAAYFAWVTLHERYHPQAMAGPRIVKTLNRTVGKWQNHAALWGTLIALPAFWHFRLLQVAAYPLLVWTLKFPKYRHGDWINVSRHKFEGLVGHDLFWCLYCDWMTGVTSLGVEMLRNVESFWCPIRFYDGKKCQNCRIDYPDVMDGWVRPEGSMQDVTETLDRMYGDGRREWFGHPARLTVKGKAVP